MGTNTEIEAKTTASDINRWTIVITVITDIKKYFDEAGTGTTIKSDEDLKKIMEERNLSAIKVAELLGCHRTAVHRYLNPNDDRHISDQKLEYLQFKLRD